MYSYVLKALSKMGGEELTLQKTRHGVYVHNLKPGDMTIINTKSTGFQIWLIFFFYATMVAVMVQSVIIPYVFPSLRYDGALMKDSGLLKGLDAESFNMWAYILAMKIKKEGWSAWELRPIQSKTGLVGLLSILYYFTGPRPWVLIPFNAVAHASSGLIIYSIIYRMAGNVKTAFISALPFILFPSAMLWYTQIHKDGFSIFGFYLILYAWILFLDIETWRNTTRSIMAIMCAYLGMTTVWVMRPYINQIAVVLLFMVLPLIVIRQIIWWRQSDLSFRRTVVAIIVTCCVTASLIPFSKGGIEESVISVSAPEAQVKKIPKTINVNPLDKYITKKKTTAAKEGTTAAKEGTTAAKEGTIAVIEVIRKTVNSIKEEIKNTYSQRVERLTSKTVKPLLDRRSLNAMDKLKSGLIDEEVLAILKTPLAVLMKEEVVRELRMPHREYMKNEYDLDTKRPLVDILSKSKEGKELIDEINANPGNDIKDMLKISFEDYLDDDTLNILNNYPEASIKVAGGLILTERPLIYFFTSDAFFYIDMITTKIKEDKAVEIKSKPFQKYLATQVNNILESALGDLVNINLIRQPSAWRRTPWLPVFIEGKLKTIAGIRRGYAETRALTIIDSDIAFSSAFDVLKYMPRALVIAFLAPFPDTWSMETSYLASNMMRIASVGEMIIVYGALLFMPYALYRWRRNVVMWVIVYVNVAILIMLSSTVCNIGTIYRMRYGYLMMMVALGIAGWGAMLLKIKGKKA
jgi:hypothetical protein